REFGELWLDVEDPFRDASRDAYTDIEAQMVAVADALKPEPPDRAAVEGELAALRALLAPFAAGRIAPGAPGRSAGAEGLSDLMAALDRAIASARANEPAAALAATRQFQTEWLDVEGLVKTRSPAVYRSTEDGMAEAAAQLRANPPRAAEAAAVLERMRADLAPIAAAPARYGVFDAAVILLREGLEALLVVAALLAFLTRSGHAQKRVWIWGGAAAGVAVSVLAAFAIQSLFSSAAAGASRELVEGVTGLVAAAMLVYVSHWLHSRANLQAWQGYVRQKVTAALEGGGLFSLAAISFLAVFREGAETALFYIGIAPSIELSDLLIGIGIGVLGLVVLALVMLVFGLRLPLRPFFLVSSLLLYYLAFKFVGSGIHALQVASAIPATPIRIPSLDALGIFPTLETTLPQLALLLLALLVLLWPRISPRDTSPASL
ncbi:MAG TPA: FTR1 family protein, partial [Chloroflexota bacterium]